MFTSITSIVSRVYATAVMSSLYQGSNTQWGAVFLFLAAITVTCVSAAEANVVDLGYSQYQGVFNPQTNITSFLGIRYAAPPTGALRWRPPQAPASLAGVQKAVTESNECFQGALGGAPTSRYRAHRKRRVAQSEDCLFLNVYVSGNVSPNAQMPVVVWIHGGGYVSLNADIDGGELIQHGKGGVISVVIQYRLGIFGFLPGAKVKANGVVNAGLLDQRFALHWVQDHIACFGGDPSKVTIWGQSAGAGSVLQHIVANGGRTIPPLFRAAITSSTYMPQQYNFNDPIPEAIYARVAQLSNCASSQDTMACLRAADANALGNVNHVMGDDGFHGTSIFVPVVDGDFIVEHPVETLRQGKVNGGALLAVTTTFEGRIFVSPSTSNISDFVTKLFPTFGKMQVDETVSQYTGVPGLSTALEQAIAVMGEAIFICPSYYLLDAFKDKGFKGQFAILPANHGDDLGQYFPSARREAAHVNPFTRSFTESFLAVVKSMDPNMKFDSADITPHWSAWGPSSTEMVFNATKAGDPAIAPITPVSGLVTRCKFWNSMASFTIGARDTGI